MKAFAESLSSIDIKINTQASIQVIHEREKLLQGLVEQINEEIIAKMEHDVRLSRIRLMDDNQLLIDGHASAMGMQKEFHVRSHLVWAKGDQSLRLKVDDIDVDGNFLVKRGFELVEPAVRKQIEKAVDFNLYDLIPQPLFAGDIKGFPERMVAAITRAVIHDIVISSVDNGLRIDFLVEDFNFSFAASSRFKA